jgi:hypothetical protein
MYHVCDTIRQKISASSIVTSPRSDKNQFVTLVGHLICMVNNYTFSRTSVCYRVLLLAIPFYVFK